MGEGEPLLNISAVISALAHFGSRYPLARGALSTSGIFPARIRELADRRIPIPMKLQISLHAPTDELRKLLIPRTASLDAIIAAASYYATKTGNPVEWNYVLLRGVNDDRSHALALIALLPHGTHIKLNRFNADPRLPFSPASDETQRSFVRVLEDGGLIAESYRTNGSDIGAGCGKLTYAVSAVVLLSPAR